MHMQMYAGTTESFLLFQFVLRNFTKVAILDVL